MEPTPRNVLISSSVSQEDSPIENGSNKRNITSAPNKKHLDQDNKRGGLLKRNKDLIEFIGLCVLILGLGAQLYYNSLMKDSVAAAREEVDVTRKAYIASHVPWLSVHDVKFNHQEQIIEFVTENSADFPALDVTFNQEYISKDDIKVNMNQQHLAEHTIIFPHEKRNMRITIVQPDIFRLIVAKTIERTLDIRFSISYRDAFGSRYTTRATVSGSLKNGELSAEDETIEGFDLIK
jgi:hypothetical protein